MLLVWAILFLQNLVRTAHRPWQAVPTILQDFIEYPGLFQGMATVGGGVLVGSGTNMIILFGGIRWPLKDFYIQTESHLPLLARGLR